jgi:hypothetical protein
MAIECAERDRLIRAHNAYLADHLRSVQVLASMTGVMLLNDYQKVRAGEERARKLAEQAAIELRAHLAEHDCADRQTASEAAGRS